MSRVSSHAVVTMLGLSPAWSLPPFASTPCLSVLLHPARLQVNHFKDFAPKVPDVEQKLRELVVQVNGDRSAIQARLQAWHDTGKLEVEESWQTTKKKVVKVGCRVP